MSALCLHALVPEDRAAPPQTLPPHRRIVLAGLGALVSEADNDLDTPEQATAAALAHHALIAGWHRAGPVLPVRLGTLFSTEAALRNALSPRVNALGAALAKLSGMDEMVLSFRTRVAQETPAPQTAPATGSDWLRARRAARDRCRARGRDRAEMLGALHQALAARGLTPVELPPREGLACWRLLVARTDRAGLDAWLAAQADDFDAAGLDVALDGPWPPYGFAADLMEALDG